MDIPNVLEGVEAMISQDRASSLPSASPDNDDNNNNSGEDFDDIHADICSDSNDCDDDDDDDDSNKDNSENQLLVEQIEFLREKQALLQRASHALALEEVYDASSAQALVREGALKRRSSNNNKDDDRAGIWEEARIFLASLEDSSCGFSKDPSPPASLPMPTMKYSSSSSSKRIRRKKTGSPADPSIDITIVKRMSSEQYDLFLMPLSEGGEDWQHSLPVTG